MDEFVLFRYYGIDCEKPLGTKGVYPNLLFTSKILSLKWMYGRLNQNEGVSITTRIHHNLP